MISYAPFPPSASLWTTLKGNLKLMISEKQKGWASWVPESLCGGEWIKSTISLHRTWSGLETNLCCVVKLLRFQGLFVIAAKMNLLWLIHRLACLSLPCGLFCSLALSLGKKKTVQILRDVAWADGRSHFCWVKYSLFPALVSPSIGDRHTRRGEGRMLAFTV